METNQRLQDFLEQEYLLSSLEAAVDAPTFDVQEWLKLIKKKLLVIILVGLVCGVLMIGYGLFLMPATYQATEKLYVNNSSSLVDLSALEMSSSLSSDYQQIFYNKEVHEIIRQRLGLDYSDDDLDDMISIKNTTSRIIEIMVSSQNSADEALRMVEEYGEVARQFVEDRMGGRMPSVFEKATLLESRRGLGMKTVTACAAGAVLYTAIISVIFILDDRIRQKRNIERGARLPILGVFQAEK